MTSKVGPAARATYSDEVLVGAGASTSRAATCTTSTEKAHNAAHLMKTVNRVLRDMFLKKLVFRPFAESMKHENVLVS